MAQAWGMILLLILFQRLGVKEKMIRSAVSYGDLVGGQCLLLMMGSVKCVLIAIRFAAVNEKLTVRGRGPRLP